MSQLDTLRLFFITFNTPIFTSVFQDQSFLFNPPLFYLAEHSLSLRKASHSNPRPTFFNCMKSDIPSVSFCLTTFRKKTNCILLWLIKDCFTGIRVSVILTMERASWNGSMAGCMSGVWKAPETGSHLTFRIRKSALFSSMNLRH